MFSKETNLEDICMRFISYLLLTSHIIRRKKQNLHSALCPMFIIVGEYTMEYSRYSPATSTTQETVIQEYHDKIAAKEEAKGTKKKN